MAYSLAFLLVEQEDSLARANPTWADLVEIQSGGLRAGFALRIYRCPAPWKGTLETLVEDRLATSQGNDPFRVAESNVPRPDSSGNPRRMICDAVIPHFNPKDLWLGVYGLRGDLTPTLSGSPDPETIQSIQFLDSFPLKEVDNETCWFYPTESGTYLSWENECQLHCLPGCLPELPTQQTPLDYSRDGFRLLWSLMADDDSLTCVGLTFQRRRIDWPLRHSTAEASSTWCSFSVDTMTTPSLRKISTITTMGPVDC